jgi:DNA-binding FrmR family transcriptional regulator
MIEQGHGRKDVTQQLAAPDEAVADMTKGASSCAKP